MEDSGEWTERGRERKKVDEHPTTELIGLGDWQTQRCRGKVRSAFEVGEEKGGGDDGRVGRAGILGSA